MFCGYSQNVCGSLTNLLKIRSEKEESDAASSSQKPEEPNEQPKEDVSMEAALDTLDEIKTQSVISDTAIMKQRATDMKQKMSSQFDALDSMLVKAENAQYSMAQQNKDIKRMLK